MFANDTFNYYLDESRIDNDEDEFMVIGAVVVPRSEVKQLKIGVRELKAKHGILGEIKWVRSDVKKDAFQTALVNHLAELPDTKLSFHCIVVNKRNLDYKTYHGGDKEKAFYSFIYHLLKQRIGSQSTNYIFLDFKPNKNKERLRRLWSRLNDYIYFDLGDSAKIRTVQSLDSKENIFIQLADFYCGAVGYQFNNRPDSTYKYALSQKIAVSVKKKDLKSGGTKYEKKFNIYHIEPGLRNW